MKQIITKPSWWIMSAGATLSALCGYAIASFQSLYLQRTFDLSAGQAAQWVNTPAYLADAIGTALTGWLAISLSKSSPTAIAWLSALGLALSVPFNFWGFTTTNLLFCAIGLSIGQFVKFGYLAAQYTISQGVVSRSVRATSTAVMLFMINMLGYGLGPPIAGLLSDFIFGREAIRTDLAGFTNAGCDAAQEAILRNPDTALADVLAGMQIPISEAQYQFCLVANAAATQNSMLVISAIYLPAALCFFLCMFTLKKDMATA